MSSDRIDIEVASNQTEKEEYKFKVVVVGDSGVGKTNLIKRFINNTFSHDSKATVGVEFLSKSYYINGKLFKVEIWDTAGQERYKSITAAYYKGAKGAMIVYDLTCQSSYDNVDRWYNEIKEIASKDINMILVGNKSDLEENRVISSDLSLTKAKALEVPVLETSALNANNVKEAFYQLLKEMYQSVTAATEKNEKAKEQINQGVALNLPEVPKKKGCCGK